jgi:hypothetical protein
MQTAIARNAPGAGGLSAPAVGPPETINLGDIAPGELLDANGNPSSSFQTWKILPAPPSRPL